jgi:stringent starvation protein B
MRPKRPYLLRALNDWIVDSDLTPYLLVGVDSEAVRVPTDYVSEGKIVLNISPAAVRDLEIGSDAVSFSGRFSGRPFPVRIPMASVLAIYAKETGEGMMFEPELDDGAVDPDPDGTGGPTGSHLKVVK